MARAVFVTYLFALAIGSTSGYAKECAVGPEYWCQSFDNARECGGIQHCLDTAWSQDEKYEKVESSTTCQWCQKILKKTHEGLGDREEMVTSTLTSACNLLPTDDLQAKCTNIITSHGTAVFSLMKKQRFATLCRLMNVCSKDESVHIVGKSRCTWGPSYWCSSLSNSRECQATDHCTTQVWAQQGLIKKDNDNICQYCESIVDKLRAYLTDGKVEINIEQWLASACGMLQNEDLVAKCKQTMGEYAKEILTLVKNNINSGVICHLGDMCAEATIAPREKLQTEQSKMLCNVLVRATHDLSINQKKSADEIERFLKKDCQQLESSELQAKCGDLVEQHGKRIYEKVGEHVELSKICDQIISQSDPHVQCDLCGLVMSSVEAMIDDKHSTDQVIECVDQQLSTLEDSAFLSKVYKALLSDNRAIIEEDLQERVGNVCDQCKNFIQTAKTQWLNGLESTRDTLLQTCERCPTKDQCRTYINRRFDNLVSYVNQIDPQSYCQQVHLCSTEKSCSACSERLNRRRDTFLSAIDRLSGYFNGLCEKSSDSQCQGIVKQMKETIEQSLNTFDSNEVCTAVGFCGAQSSELDLDDYEKSVEQDIDENVCSLVGPFRGLCQDILHGNLEKIEQMKMDFTLDDLLEVSDEQKGDKCKCCIARVRARLRRTKYIGDQVYDSLIRSCRRCPVAERCRRAYRREKAEFDARIRHICPYLVCVKYGYCNKTKTAIQTVDRSNSTCILCEYIMNYLSAYLQSNSTEEEIEESLESVCDRMPKVLQSQCREYVEDYSPTIIAVLLNDFDLKSVCQKLNLCTPNMKVQISHFTQADANTCAVCDYVATYMHFELERDANSKALASVCQHLSEESQAKCQSLVQFFAPDIQQLDLSPKENFCKQLPICQTPMSSLEAAKAIDALPTCTLCEYVISYLDAALKNNQSEAAIEDALSKVCTILPSSERTQCNQLVKTYGPIVAQLIAEAVDPATVCHRIGLCAEQKVPPPAMEKAKLVIY